MIWIDRDIKAGMRMFDNPYCPICPLWGSGQDRYRVDIRQWNLANRPNDILRCPRCHAPFEQTPYSKSALRVWLFNRIKDRPFFNIGCWHCGWEIQTEFQHAFLADTIEKGRKWKGLRIYERSENK